MKGADEFKKFENKCEHCYHAKQGSIMMVIPDGHVVQECCKCHRTRTVHAEHAFSRRY